LHSPRLPRFPPPIMTSAPNTTSPMSYHQPGQIAHPNQVVRGGTWSHGLCECSSIGTCCLGLLCPCILYGRTQYRLSMKSKKEDPTNMLGYETCNGSCTAMALLCGCQCKFHNQTGQQSFDTEFAQGCWLRCSTHGHAKHTILRATSDLIVCERHAAHVARSYKTRRNSRLGKKSEKELLGPRGRRCYHHMQRPCRCPMASHRHDVQTDCYQSLTLYHSVKRMLLRTCLSNIGGRYFLGQDDETCSFFATLFRGASNLRAALQSLCILCYDLHPSALSERYSPALDRVLAASKILPNYQANAYTMYIKGI
jgi:hypothetical protein